MQIINSSDMYFTGDGILSFWLGETGASLIKNCEQEILESAEMVKLAKFPKIVIMHANSPDGSSSFGKMYQQGKLKWILENKSESWEVNGTESGRRGALLFAWESKHGVLPRKLESSFLVRKELDLIILFRKSLVVEKINNHKKLSEILLALQNSPAEKEFDWRSRVYEAQRIFARLETRFRNEIIREQRMLGSNQTSRHETVCNACGMILPLFNYHDC